MITVTAEIASNLVEVAAEIASVTVGGGTASITVSNSDDTYSVTTSVDLELPDQSIDVFLDGDFIEAVTYPAMTEPNITIEWQ